MNYTNIINNLYKKISPEIDKDVYELYIKETKETVIKRLSIAIVIMGTPLVISFFFVDMFYKPMLWKQLFWVRLSIIGIGIICLSMLKSSLFSGKRYYLCVYAYTFGIGLINTILIYLSDPYHLGYYFGLALVIMGTSFLQLRVKDYLLSSLCICAPFFLLLSIYSHKSTASIIVPVISFIFSTIFLGMVPSFLTAFLKSSEIKSRINDNINKQKLAETIENQERLINQKTQQGVYLEKLSSQFSESVINAIKNGQLDIERIYTRKIAIIFIDIVNSSSKTRSLDREAHIEVIKTYFPQIREILTKHQATLGTYLGDGFLSFVNAPTDVENYQQLAVKACLEILALHARRKKYLNKRWKSNFNIRIGLNIGETDCGFFPDAKHGTYTPIGEPVNLAARLCSIAKEDSLCINEDLLLMCHKEIGKEGTAKKLGKMSELRVKGYEDDDTMLYVIKTKEILETQNIFRCSRCDGRMILDSSYDNDWYIYKCEICLFPEYVEKSELENQPK